ncbi:cell wall metabolism sensor histidine kinase WalK [Paenibacillus sp. OV219]|uniref:sensor histidine kinase n=1 Tax=Paenibacillus sp. OV219 TaxID=1884377 RepID=UPI0008C8B358|nr:ATP-binding protein [Paenibacillus sp. OV219]SEM54626.1 His Kinase A (phospho-acceptor) domain-containing protein [Paenibacillus sp. OV219]
MFKRTRTRLTREFSLTIGIILMISAIFSLWMVQQMLTTTEDNQLKSLSNQYEAELQKLIESPKGNALFDPSVEREKVNSFYEPGGLQLNQMAWLLDPNGEMIFQSSPSNKNSSGVNFPLTALLPSLHAEPDNVYRNVSANGRTFRIGGTILSNSKINDYRIIVAQEVTSDTDLLSQLRWAFAGFALLMLAAGGAAGYILAGRAMGPISQAFHRQEQFTSDASHELRTPLSILKSAYEVLDEESDKLPDFHRNVFMKTGREIHHMSRLVDNLLVLARSDSGRIELVLSRFSLRHTILQVMEQLEPIATSKHVKLIWENRQSGSGVDDAMIQADEVRIRQLILIVIENAIQYNREGGSVIVSLETNPQKVSFIVRDTGIGIENEHLPRIFERFYRMDKARTRRSEGTGLGLAIAKQIVDAHRAKIEVWSTPQVGTTFRVSLPSISDSFQNVSLS